MRRSEQTKLRAAGTRIFFSLLVATSAAIAPCVLSAQPAIGDATDVKTMSATADEPSDSDLILALKQEMERTKKLEAKLDVPQQILIETVVLEVELPKDSTLAKKIRGHESPAPAECFLGRNVRWFTNLVVADTTNSADGQQAGFRYAADLGGSVDSIITALCLDRRVVVLQQPQILTPNGQPGYIFVGDTFPDPHPDTNQYLGGPGCSRPLQTGIGLKITPLIQSNGLIALAVDETVDKVVGKTEIAGVGDVPNTMTSRSQASVTVRDGDFVVLGGDVRSLEQRPAGNSFLKRIPLIGSLFRSSAERAGRGELVLLLRLTELPQRADANSQSPIVNARIALVSEAQLRTRTMFLPLPAAQRGERAGETGCRSNISGFPGTHLLSPTLSSVSRRRGRSVRVPSCARLPAIAPQAPAPGH